MGQGKSLTTEEKKVIVSLKEYFDRTKDDPQEHAYPSVQKVAKALGFGIATIKRIMANYNRGIYFEDMEQVYRGRPQRAHSDSIRVFPASLREKENFVVYGVFSAGLGRCNKFVRIRIRSSGGLLCVLGADHRFPACQTGGLIEGWMRGSRRIICSRGFSCSSRASSFEEHRAFL